MAQIVIEGQAKGPLNEVITTKTPETEVSTIQGKTTTHQILPEKVGSNNPILRFGLLTN